MSNPKPAKAANTEAAVLAPPSGATTAFDSLECVLAGCHDRHFAQPAQSELHDHAQLQRDAMARAIWTQLEHSATHGVAASPTPLSTTAGNTDLLQSRGGQIATNHEPTMPSLNPGHRPNAELSTPDAHSRAVNLEVGRVIDGVMQPVGRVTASMAPTTDLLKTIHDVADRADAFDIGSTPVGRGIVSGPTGSTATLLTRSAARTSAI